MRTNHEEDLRLWNDVPATVGHTKADQDMDPIPVQTNQENENESEGEDEEYKVDPFYYQPEPTNLQAASGKLAKEERDDEQEVTRIPIAGKDSEHQKTMNWKRKRTKTTWH